MTGLHQQLAGKRSDLKANEVKARSMKADPRDASDAKERLPFLRQQISTLETDIELGEIAAKSLTATLNHARTIATGGRELALAITYLETAEFRLKNHLGTAAGPSKPTVQAD